MAYQKTRWVNDQTPLNEGNLNKLEQGVEDAHDYIDQHELEIDDVKDTVYNDHAERISLNESRIEELYSSGNGGGGGGIETVDWQDVENKPEIIEDESDSFYIADTQGNIILKVDSNGIHSVNLTLNNKTINQIIQENTPSGNYNDLENRPEIIDDGYAELSIVDSQGNVVAKITNEGIQAVNFLVGETKDEVALAKDIVDTRVRYSHFSIDDFYVAFQDLTNNASSYNSIFDNETFAWLKTFHETTGATISCYCFYQNAVSNPTFTLDMVPTKYRSEFQANSDWLKFGFHSLTGNGNYASATYEKAKEDYELTINALFNITGHINCIDTMPRLHNFAGSLEACKGMRDAVCGVKGFMAAFNAADGGVRPSYYLPEEDNNYLYTHDYLYDASVGLHFVRTQDGGTLYYPSYFSTNIQFANKSRYVEFFTHEVQLIGNLRSTLVNAFKALLKTHKPVFWQDIFR